MTTQYKRYNGIKHVMLWGAQRTGRRGGGPWAYLNILVCVPGTYIPGSCFYHQRDGHAAYSARSNKVLFETTASYLLPALVRQ